MFNLNGNVGIVTGASSGLGLGIANVLAEAGARVYAVSRTGGLKDPSAACHASIVHVKADICDTEQMERLVREIGDSQGLDFLVNNAGITVKCRAEEFQMEDFKKIHQVNVESVFFLSKLCYPYLKQSKHAGRIVNITSMAALCFVFCCSSRFRPQAGGSHARQGHLIQLHGPVRSGRDAKYGVGTGYSRRRPGERRGFGRRVSGHPGQGHPAGPPCGPLPPVA